MADETKEELLAQFVATNPGYYSRQFQTIGAKAGFAWTFNLIAALLGPIWYGMRGLWNWGLPFVILETFAFIQIGRGLFGDLGAEVRERIKQIEGTLALRYEQLQAAIDKGDDGAAFQRNIDSLEGAIDGIRAEAERADATAIWVALFGVAFLILVKIAEGVMANPVLERRYSDWLSDRSIKSGLEPMRTGVSVVFVLVVFAVSVVHFAFPGAVAWLTDFPTDPAIRLTAIDWVEAFFDFIIATGQWLFDIITFGIRTVLDALEVLFVDTPWPVIAAMIILLTWLSAGTGAAFAAAGFLAYMGFLGFWEKAMTTLALLGTAACISIALGIPIGMFCARRPRLYAFIRPIMDFMQTMPAFVFMIPVIAFFGTGKPAAVVTTMIFGGTPVVRLTVLGLRGVPESIREAAIAYGASKWYLLTKVDLPLAAPSILAGVNQTIMLSLAMVVVASLIGAKGLGEDVLEALQYASVGQGILAGFAILFCAMILDRVVQGKRE
ncbi:ABC transporter permease [Roseovarius aestuarii]|uniref:Glycine betaine/L-proline transport system permease protein ProW n=1 Tax=Roseovarius aestuarii TaxID=475083 RepID=A0A1X7BSJ6_9RHOB|nr:ABC transporter permease subunit [Roseovarius aestuarii]SMC12656.1 Glycine betaine/L-proline transport system permease protein ProW [Roseovarius aestuarii]